MAEMILFSSSKGGVGTSTVCSIVGARIASKGKRVLLLEGTMRALDELLDVADRVVYDWQDAIAGTCTLEEAMVTVSEDENLMLICAPAKHGMDVHEEDVKQVISKFSDSFDYILADVNGRDEEAVTSFSHFINSAIIVTTVDRSAVRNNAELSELLSGAGVHDIRLCVNQISADFVRQRSIPNLDWIIDSICAQLIAVIPFNPILTSAPNVRYLVGSSNQIAIFFENLAQRIMGNYIDLSVW